MERLPYDPNLRLNELQPFRKLFEIESEYMASQGYYQNERLAALRQFAVSYVEEVKIPCSLFQYQHQYENSVFYVLLLL